MSVSHKTVLHCLHRGGNLRHRYAIWILLWLGVWTSLLQFARAAPAPVFTYQARLGDTFGVTVADGTYSFRFRIYDTALGGTTLWSESHTANVTNGVVSVRLGTSTAINLDFNSGDYYLGVAIGSDSELSPRIQLGAVPYAANSKLHDGHAVGTGPNQIPALDAASKLSLAGDFATTGAGTIQGGLTVTNGVTVSSGAVNLPANSIQTAAIADNAITGAKILDGTVGTTDLANAAVTAVKLSVAAIDANGKIPALTSTYLASLDGSALTGVAAGSVAASAITGTTLASTVVASSLTSVGTLSSLTVSGAATVGTLNGLTVTTSTGTLTVANGKTLTASNTLTLTGTDSSSVAFGSGGTVAYTANKLSAFAATSASELSSVISDKTGSGVLVFGSSPSLQMATLTSPTITTGLTLTRGGNQIWTFGVAADTSPGDSLTIQGGAGGTGTTGGAGGGVTIQGGNSNGTGSNTGGNVVINAGSAGGSTTNGPGGYIRLTPGAPTGSGAMGYVEIAGGAAGSHLRSTQITAPTAGTPSNCGSGTGPSASVATGSTDMAGSVSIVSGSAGSPTTCDTVFTFNKAYAAPPKAVLLTTVTGNRSGGVLVVTNTAFTVGVSPNPSNNLTMTWYYLVVE